MPNLSWEELSKIKHQIRDEQTVIRGIHLRLNEINRVLDRIADSINKIILDHENENNND